MGVGWFTGTKAPAGAPPTACAGLRFWPSVSAARAAQSGFAVSRARRSRASASYSLSGISGASCSWYARLWRATSARSAR